MWSSQTALFQISALYIGGEIGMAQKMTSRGSNLFSIDLEAIEAVLADANATLIQKAENLIAESSSFGGEISDIDQAEKLRKFIKVLRSQTKEVSNARLNDGRPFTDAANVVKTWFGRTENKLKTTEKQLSRLLANYTLKAQREAEEVRKRNANLQSFSTNVKNPEPQVVGVASSGEAVVQVNRPNQSSEVMLEPVPEAPQIELALQVQSFQRDRIDLEALRPFLTDYAIQNAINAHVKKTGVKLDGVIYEEVVTKNI